MKMKSKPPRTGPHKEYYDNGQLSLAGSFVNGRKSGLWTYSLRNGVVRARGRFADGSAPRRCRREVRMTA
jgi:antitoxin component YwqK of YwqJK toxin-antitoxin module